MLPVHHMPRHHDQLLYHNQQRKYKTIATAGVGLLSRE